MRSHCCIVLLSLLFPPFTKNTENKPIIKHYKQNRPKHWFGIMTFC